MSDLDQPIERHRRAVAPTTDGTRLTQTAGSAGRCRTRPGEAGTPRLLAWLAVAAALTTRLAVAAPALHVEPGVEVLEGEPVHLVLRGLVPGQAVELVAERWFAPASVPARAPRLMRSHAVFEACADGTVDLRRAAPLRGTWQGVDTRGPFWSMLPVAGVAPASEPVDTSEVRLRAIADGVDIRSRVRLLRELPQVRTVPAAGLPGARFATLPGRQPRPALILLGGSEGGSVVTQDAGRFASHGFAVLALPLFSPPLKDGSHELPELPPGWVDMPVETLDRARAWLAERPEVDATRIAVHGTSMGAVLALLGAAQYGWLRGVVASVPSDVVWEGWGPGVAAGRRSTFSLAGEPLPFVPLVGYDDEVAGAARGEPVVVRRAFDRGRAARPDLALAARIPVERIAAPLLVIAGHDDRMWASGPMAERIVERRREAGLPTEALIDADAGHLLHDTGYAPTTGYNAGSRTTGGDARSNARAQAQAWALTLAFLRRVLQVERP